MTDQATICLACGHRLNPTTSLDGYHPECYPAKVRLRDEFAKAALAAGPSNFMYLDVDDRATYCYKLADAMLAAREKRRD